MARMDHDAQSGFRSVDATERPEVFVEAMDRVRGMDATRRWKRRSFELLDLRPGDRVLDVGCGPGDDARALAELVGPSGQAVGIDFSAAMVRAARERSASDGRPTRFAVGDASRLSFPDGCFDAVRAERLLVHLTDPAAAVAEMVRVTRSGGRIAIVDIDADTVIVDHPDRRVTRRIMQHAADRFASGLIGRRLKGHLAATGLADVTAAADAIVMEDFERAEPVMGLRNAAGRAHAAGAITDAERDAWLARLDELAAANMFFAAATIFIAAGRKP